MATSDDEDETLVNFLELEVLSEVSDQDEELKTRPSPLPPSSQSPSPSSNKRPRLDQGTSQSPSSSSNKRLLLDQGISQSPSSSSNKRLRLDQGTSRSRSSSSNKRPHLDQGTSRSPSPPSNTRLRIDQGTSQVSCHCQIETGIFSKIPPELFHHILKFLSSEDLISCSLVCRFLNSAASDECLWRRLYCMRWGLSSPTGKLRECAWKKLYIQRDEEDMAEFVKNTPSEFKEYYVQMQAAKRSQAPLLSQVNDDRIILDKTVADQVSIWRSSRGLTDEVVADHACSGETCCYSQIGDVFLCEKTGRVHVCDDTCREVVWDPSNGLLVCTISGHCFDGLLLPSEEETDAEQQQGGVMDDPEPFMGSGRFGCSP
ncbi:F-box protein SKIP31 isoform X2 [Magnolia sinica]|uniref:F-box protein SKIP31 isoform X2 n=1 Tax=Magnolia sinica TaxID=86752 RepID=UPI002658330E|nr:F-box protein SKIP31 isoform X2 [Magnolia sinica]XP_058085198.1 F-box protein SKIP31 isoform X2 [Magnolia sinica]